MSSTRARPFKTPPLKRRTTITTEEEEENTSDNNENRNFARRTRKRLNELRELAPSTAKPMLVLNALSDEEDEDTTSKSKKKNGSNDRRSWQKVFDVLDAYERHQEDGDGDKYSSKSELIAKLREVAKAIRLAAKNTTEEEDDDDFYEAQHTSEGKPTPPSRLLSSPISKTPPPVKPRKLRAKNRKKNDDDDAKDDGENDDDDKRFRRRRKRDRWCVQRVRPEHGRFARRRRETFFAPLEEIRKRRTKNKEYSF